MVETGDPAPDFVAPLAHGEISEFALSDHVPSDAPIVLAFFPGAFTSVCSHELATFQDRLPTLEEHGASVYGVSVDLPFALEEFRSDLGVEFGLLSDANRQLIDVYDASMDFGHLGLSNVAKRAVFVVDGDMTVAYDWVADDPSLEPDYDEVVAAVEATA